MSLGGGQSKYWCFTINNPRKNYKDLDGLKNWSYMVVGNETGENGTPHLQGFVVFKTRTKFSTVKNQLAKAHIEQMKGTPKQASTYCMKDGNYEVFGELPNDYKGGASGGIRKRENFKDMVKFAKSDKFDDILELDPVSYVQHYHAFKRILQDYPIKPNDLNDVCGEWIYGPPNVGKSYTARQENPDLYDKAINKWWDGYQGESCVLLDDFDLVHNILGHHLKRWADKYSFPAEIKGTTRQIRPSKIVVTSNYTIDEIFSQHGNVLCDALKRRFKVRHMINPFNFPLIQDAPIIIQDDPYDSDIGEL